jgi:hypothetical protein
MEKTLLNAFLKKLLLGVCIVVCCCEEVGKNWGKSRFGDKKTARILALTA